MRYNACNYLSMLGLKLNHGSKRGPMWFIDWQYLRLLCWHWDHDAIVPVSVNKHWAIRTSCANTTTHSANTIYNCLDELECKMQCLVNWKKRMINATHQHSHYYCTQTRSKTSITLLEIAAKVPYASLRVSGLTGGSLYNICEGRV